MTARRFLLASAAVLLAATLAACTGEPDPVETTPGFATEAEAFAAAEETYRAYVDALNQVDLADPETFEAVYAWTTGDANAAARESFSQMHADQWTVAGESLVRTVTPLPDQSSLPDNAQLRVCLDVSSVTLVDPTGASVVSDDRPDVQQMLIVAVPDEASPTGAALDRIDGYSGDLTCD